MLLKKLLDQLKRRFFHSRTKKPLTLRKDLENSRLRLENLDKNSKLIYLTTSSKQVLKSLKMLINALVTTSLKYKRLKMRLKSLTILRLFSICKSLLTNNLKTAAMSLST